MAVAPSSIKMPVHVEFIVVAAVTQPGGVEFKMKWESRWIEVLKYKDRNIKYNTGPVSHKHSLISNSCNAFGFLATRVGAKDVA